MSREWYLPTGRTADEFMAEMKGNLRHDAEHLFGRIRQADQRIEELKAVLRDIYTLNVSAEGYERHCFRLKDIAGKALEQDDE